MGKTAYLYPGQGAQQTGMCQAFYERYPSVRKRIAEASEILGYGLAELMFEPDERLNETAYTQPAMVAAELAMTQVVDGLLAAKGIRADYSAGLSLGEYAAIASAGGFSFEEAVKTVAVRGKRMAEAVPAGQGAMAAVLGARTGQVEEIVHAMDGVYIANYNCPGQLVLTGYRTAVEEAIQRLQAAGVRKCVFLKVSGPFHSPLLAGAGKKLLPVLEAIEWKPFSHPYVANVHAGIVTEPGQTAELLARQVSSPVRWEQSIVTLLQNGVRTFLEIGPGRTLSGFMKKIIRAHAEELGISEAEIRMIGIAVPEDLAALEEL
ncbi:MAG: ACP S-malonyltransferase [Eubacteriales bacterium]|nr:ACP S-malonyltransferase [Eubacteriales bacterium]